MISRRLTIGTLAVGAAGLGLASAPAALAVYPSQARITAGSQAAATQVTITAVNQNVLAIKSLSSGLVFTCPPGGVTLTGATTVGTNNNNPAMTITNFSTVGCRLSNADLSIRNTLPWRVRANSPSTPTEGPSSGQVSSLEINSFLADAEIGTCKAKLGAGTAVVYPSAGAPGVIDNSGGSFGVKYTNGNPSSLQINTTDSAASAKLGVNSTSLSGGCFAGAVKAGSKIRLYGLATVSSTAPINAVFAVTARVTASGATANPVWLATP